MLSHAQVLAVVTAASTEALGKGVFDPPADDDDDASPFDAMDWTAVAQGTGLNFLRDTSANVLQRVSEKVAKPVVSPATHREMVKLLPKMARQHYAAAAADGAKWSAAVSTSLAVLQSPVFYLMRSACALLADVGVDVMRVAYGTLSEDAFKQNAALKLVKHSASCACCLATGGLLPLTLGVPSHLLFIVADLVGGLVGDQIVASIFDGKAIV